MPIFRGVQPPNTSHCVQSIFAGFIAALTCTGPIPAIGQSCPQVAGWVETATVADPPRAIEAKLDAGAETPALSAVAIAKLTRDGRHWRWPALDQVFIECGRTR